MLKQGIEVCAITHKNTNNLQKHPSLKIISCNLSDIYTLIDKIEEKKYDTFYHFAWEGSAGPQRSDYVLQLQNVKHSLDAMEVAKKLGCERFIVSGSIIEHETIAAVYEPDNSPGPAYIYGAGKTALHLMAAPLATKLGIQLIWAEITNAYGVGEISPRLVNSTLRKCIAGEPPEFTSGTQNYDFIYIDDLASAFYLLGMNGKPNRSYLLGSTHAKPLKEHLLEMQSSVAQNLEFKFGDVPFTGVNLPLEKFDMKMMKEDTGFKPQTSFAEGCKKTMEWLREV